MSDLAQNTDLFDKMENVSNADVKPSWKGTFRDFLRLFETQKDQYPNIGALAHERIYNMILAAGTEEQDSFGKKRTKYKFFEDHLYGVEDTVDEIMMYLYSAAQRTEAARRLLLLFGPPSSGKSEIANLLKRGLEKYSRTNEGAVYAIEGSDMHENPFLLVPHEFRAEFAQRYGVAIEGELSPMSRYRLINEFNGKFMDYPIERIYMSEATRVGIGTWLPSDEKAQDISELVGSINLAKIGDVGSDSDPRAYNFDGELNVANRGIMEYIEGLKANEKFLRSNLTATQEKSIKAPRFGLIPIDVFIIMHTNESEFDLFMKEEKYEAYHDRMVVVRAPYNVGIRNEVKIYQKLLDNSTALRRMHMAPNTLETAAMFSVLSRLQPSEGDLTPVKKMKLYNEERVKGYKIEQVADIKRKAPREGMSGISPRFVIDQISFAISKSRSEGRNFVTAIDILRQVNKGIRGRDSFSTEEKTQYEQFIDIARSEYNELLRNDIQKAFFLSFEDEAKVLFNKYLDQVEASCSGTQITDPVTGEKVDPDEKLMSAMENHIGVSNSGRDDFRNEIMRHVATAGRSGKTFDYTQHAGLREAIQKQLFEERKGVIQMTVSTRNPEPEALSRLNDVVKRMVEKQGYTAESANELLKYATAHLFDK